MRQVQARDGTNLFVKEWGQGRPVVLIHGWPLSADSWDPVALALAEDGYRAIAYDRRGFGRSDQPWTGNDYDTYADDLADVMKACKSEGDATLVGFSMGGGEIARYLSRHGASAIRSVALVGSIVPFVLKTPDNPDGTDQATFDQMEAQMRKDRGRFMKNFFNDFYGVGWVTQPVTDEVLEWSWATAMMAGLHPTLAAAKAFSTTDFRPDLPSFTVPTLVIHGTADKTVPIDATARVVADLVPGARLIEYDGSPHGLFATDKDRLIGDILTFVRAH